MLSDKTLEQIINLAKAFIDSCHNPLCIVDRTNKIVYFNNEFSNLLEIQAVELRKGLIFCEIVKTEICQDNCKIIALLENKQSIHTEIISAKANNRDLRIKLKATPLYDTDPSGITSLIGAVIQLE